MHSEWREKTFEEIFTCKPKSFKPTENKEEKYLGLEHLEQETGKIIGVGSSLETLSNKYVFENGDILFGKLRPYLRKYYFADFKGVCTTEILPLKSKENMNAKFCYFLVQDETFIEFINAKTFGTKMPRTSWEDIKQYSVWVPNNKQEQQKIADILSTVDEQIDNVDRLIEKTKELKKGLMQQLLTKGIGHTELKETEVGVIPKEWEVKKLGEICDVKGGKRLPKGHQLLEQNNGYPYIRVADMYMGGVNLNQIRYVPEEAVNSIKNYKITSEDLFISVAGTLGIVGKIPNELNNANLTENADKLCEIKINKDYLLWVLQSDMIQQIINTEKTSNAQPKLALTRIKEFLIPIPTQIEQEKIDKIISAVDMKLLNYTLKKEKLQQLKKGLMQQLLTGKIRVKVD